MDVKILTIEKSLFTGKARSITVPGSTGEMTILVGHEPLVSALKQGVITVHTDTDAAETFQIEKGYLEVTGTQVTVLL